MTSPSTSPSEKVVAEFVHLLYPSRPNEWFYMPKQKTHKGLAKRIKVTKTGKVRFFGPNSRHLKSNKRGTTVQTYRKARFARNGDTKMYGKLLNRSLLSQQQHTAAKVAREDKAAEGG